MVLQFSLNLEPCRIVGLLMVSLMNHALVVLPELFYTMLRVNSQKGF